VYADGVLVVRRVPVGRVLVSVRGA